MGARQLKQLPATALDENGLRDNRRSRRQHRLKPPSALAQRQRPKVCSIQPQQIERDVGRPPRAAEEVVKLRTARLVGGDHLTIEDSVMDAEGGRDLLTQRIEPGEHIASSRDEATAPALDIPGATISLMNFFFAECELLHTSVTGGGCSYMAGSIGGGLMRIVQISDTHLSPDKPHFVRNWAPLAAWIGDQHPDLVIHTGDVTADGAGGRN